MINITKQINYWKNGADEDFPVGKHLVQKGNIRHGLFFVHLALEKILKAHVCLKIQDIAPRTHNLAHLLELSGVACSKEDARFLGDLNKYNIEGRYPDSYEDLPEPMEAEKILTESERIYTWLRSQL
ncbi:MAG: HEPN domain-containing protein [Chitinivibrionales bacterium]|nr:HEPN domain-containing protein [Chitinivibrionales bacterium]